ncbi:MAG: serine aminopeptidase domain-containing protein, partial [Thermomonas sp.]
DVGSPVLVLHGSADRLIRPELGQRLYERATDPKRFVLVEGASHHSASAIGLPQLRDALGELFGVRAE